MNALTQQRILSAVDALGGVLTPQNAEPLGISRTLLTHARNEGVLIRPRRGIYVRPDVQVAEARLEAVRLGPPAVLSHRGGGGFYGMDGVARGVLEWSIPHQRRKPAGNVHLRRRFEDLDIIEVDGLLVTSPLQTLADLGSVVDADIVERALEYVLRTGLATEAEVRAFAATGVAWRHGSPALRHVLARRPVGAPPTESDAETLALQIYRKYAVPEPKRQHEIWDGDLFVARVDFHWDPIPFGTEVDGLASHGSHDALQYDLNRANRVGDALHLIRRFTYWDVTRRQAYVARETLKGLATTRDLFAKRNQAG